MTSSQPDWLSYRWEGDITSRPLGQMEQLLNARRSWSGAMTTAHVSAAVLEGTPPTETELLEGISWVLQRHPMLMTCVRGKGKHFIPNAQPYPMHMDYLGRAFHYNKELFKPEPDSDIQRFEASSLPVEELAQRALYIIELPMHSSPDELDTAWKAAFDAAMDGSIFDEDGDGPLWRMTLVRSEGGGVISALIYQANHAVSDQLSFNFILDEMLAVCAKLRAEGTVEPPEQLPLPPSVEGALLGKEQRQAEEIKARLELIIGRFKLVKLGLPGGSELTIPQWEPGRARLSTIKYALWQMAASGMKVLPRWVLPATSIIGQEAKWQHQARRTRSIFRSVDAAKTSALLAACRTRSVTVSGALCAAAVLASSDAMGTEEDPQIPHAKQRYKLLQALDMRTMAFCEGEHQRPGAREDWSKGTVVAGTGSMDLLLELPPLAGMAVRSAEQDAFETFWDVAIECNQQTRSWISSGWARESLLLFASGWEFMNMNRVVELGAQDRGTLGRAYSAGVSNVGVFAHSTTHGDIRLAQLHFGISQSVSAPAISTSAVTVRGRLFLTISYAIPIWPDAEAEAYANNLVCMLEMAAAEATDSTAVASD
eukprot:CAMPEP_0119307144 /NCGR_PEP_ID=MMETSP1333-20130426/7714_1 /TAXON_ID=418940 /ORGANISM="Scyphosphaera apsteinii, Strain RCC1455" /LENGTH=596 /DNA_ID=CAMNT_0007310617 /DNA_START=320 /DNA_END=2110 /DNA_ORIENTATION=-